MPSKKIRAKKKKELPELPKLPSLPEDVMVHEILPRVPRCYYPTLSLVSKHIRSLVTSPELYERRSLLGCTEHCLYVVLYDAKTKNRLYTLHWKANGPRLVSIPSLPTMPYCGTYVVVGSRIYVFGEYNSYHKISSPFSIDCKSHAVQFLPNMPTPMYETKGGGIIDGKIYLFGTTDDGWVMLIFDMVSQMWETDIIRLDMNLGGLHKWDGCVAMADKMYIGDYPYSYVYAPKENKWSKKNFKPFNQSCWRHPCVVDDDIFYYYNCSQDYDDPNRLKAYDPKQRCWKVVYGVKEIFPDWSSIVWSDMVSYGGKLVLLFTRMNTIIKTRKTWCVEIALVRKKGGEIWGNIERIYQVVMNDACFLFKKALSVVV